MRLSQEAIQRMISGRSGGGVGGGGSFDPSALAGYATQAWTQENYISKTFFNELFVVHKKVTTVVMDGETEISRTVTTNTVFAPNETPGTTETTDEETGYVTTVTTEITSIESKKGFWTNYFLSALGLNNGGGSLSLNEPLLSINNAGLSIPSESGVAIMWNGSAWTYQVPGGGSGGGGTVTSVGLTMPTGFSVDGQPVTGSGTLAVSFGGSVAANRVLASPNGSSGAPSWRALVSADIPDLSNIYVVTSAINDMATKTWVGQQGYITSSAISDMATKTWVAQQGFLTSASGTFWGKSWSNGGTVNGTIYAGSGGGSIEQFTSIELNSAGTLSNYGGFIDFHYNAQGTTFDPKVDYTSRIIEDASGVINLNNALYAKISGNVSIGTSTISNTYKLNVNGYTKTTRLYLTDSVYLMYDSANSGVKLVGAGFYTDSYVSALGLNSGSGGVTLNEPLNAINNAGLGTPTQSGVAIMWNGSAWTYQVPGGGSGGGGTVTSVGLTMPTGFSVAGQPVTGSGTIIITFANGYSLPLTTDVNKGVTAYGWGDHSLAGYATQSWVGQQGYLTSSAISDMATKTWVGQQGYLTSSAISDMATKTWVGQQGYLTSSAISDMATKTWVGQQGYITSSAISDMATKTWVGQQGFLTSASGTFWGKSWSNGGTVNGTIYAGSGGGSILQFESIELNSAGTISDYGGFIDFHYHAQGSTFDPTIDYTSRIIEDASGVINLNNAIYAKLNGNVSIGTSTISNTYKLNVNGYTKTTRLYLTDSVYLMYDSANSGVKLVGAGFYTDSYISALGLNSGSGGGGTTIQTLSWTYGNVTSASGNSYDGSATKSFKIPKYTSDIINDSSFITSSALGSYLPLSGGTMTGLLSIATGIGLQDATGNGLLCYHPTSYTGVTSSQWGAGAVDCQGVIRSNASNLLHYRGNTSYDILDSYNSGISGNTITINGSSINVRNSLLEYKNLSTAGWYRVADVSGYGGSILLSVSQNYDNNPPNPVSFIISHGYSGTNINDPYDNITQIGGCSTRGPISNVRLMRYAAGKIYIEIYYSVSSQNQVGIEIIPLGGRLHDYITLVDFTRITSTSGLTLADYCPVMSGNVSGVGYTGDGGQEAPDFFGRNKVGFLMSNQTVNGDSTYKNWMYMDCYHYTDAGGPTAIGVSRENGRMFIMQSNSYRSSWGTLREVIVTDSGSSQTTMPGSVIPSTTGTYNLGSTTKAWHNLYLSDSANYYSMIYMGPEGLTLSASSSSIPVYVQNSLGVGGTDTSYKLYVNGTSNLNGNVYVKGTLTHSSDMRMKDFIENTEIDVEAIARAPLFKFTWRDKEIDLLTHIGTSAQYWQGVAAETVTADGAGTLGLDYGVAAIGSVISVARRVMTHEEEIAALKRRIGELRNEIETLKAA